MDHHHHHLFLLLLHNNVISDPGIIARIYDALATVPYPKIEFSKNATVCDKNFYILSSSSRYVVKRKKK